MSDREREEFEYIDRYTRRRLREEFAKADRADRLKAKYSTPFSFLKVVSKPDRADRS